MLNYSSIAPYQLFLGKDKNERNLGMYLQLTYRRESNS